MKKKQHYFQLLLCLCFIFCMTACAKRTDVSDSEKYIYCLNEDKTGLVKVEFEYSTGDVKKAAEEILTELSSSSEDLECIQAIPDEVKVQSCKIDGMIAIIDFSDSYYELSSIDEKLLRAAVVQSLMQIDGIIGIKFTVQGDDLQNPDGSTVGVMSRDDFVQNIGIALDEYQTTKIVLYFANETGDGLVAEKREVKYTSNETVEKLIVENLLNGPKKTGLYPTINPQAALLSVTTKEEVCYVNFDSGFLSRMYDVKPEVIIYSIVNSLIDGSSIYKVQITVNGEKDVMFEDAVDLSKPFQADFSYVE